ncbi:glycosyltransferase [Polynucleobacter paneuropaeus]|nr:glycosyltransferase [Polynucleobacter paneuropaeus]
MNIALVIPIFNDWNSFFLLCKKINELVSSWGVEITIFAINDYSTPANIPRNLPYSFPQIRKIEVVSLFCNLGHQRAIAVGLTIVNECKNFNAVIVCDGDGEDRPEDMGKMIKLFLQNNQSILLARRFKRSESFAFQFFYKVYKSLFRVLTGRVIDFGNFCLIPTSKLPAIVYMPECWNNLASTLIRSKIDLCRFDSVRGVRLEGSSSMNLVALIAHGLSAISVFADEVLVRLLLFSFFTGVLTFLIALASVLIRFTTSLAIPGWATTVVGVSVVVIMQSLMICLVAICWLLGSRSTTQFIPGIHAKEYVCERFELNSLRYT